MPGNLEHRRSAGRLRLDFDFLVVEFAGPQLLAKGIARRRARVGADQRIEHALFRGELRARLNVLALALADLCDPNLDQIADDLLDVPPDISHLGELGRFHLDKGRVRKLGQPPRDFRLADAGRADHQNVFRKHFFAHRPGQLLAAPAVAQGDRDGAFGVSLADDEAVEFGNDFAGREVRHDLKIC